MEIKPLVFRSPLEESIVLPSSKRKCPWTKDLHKTEISPHSKRDWKWTSTKILPNILSAVGSTPMVRLNNIPKAEGIECDIYAKCEFLNPAGSIKDRMVLRIIEDGENTGVVKPGATFIEASSGNTGIGLAWACAIKGYKCIIVMPDKVSQEKEDVIKALGGDIVRASMEVPLDDPEGFFGKVHWLHKKIPNSVILDQFSNPANPLMHYDTTAEEILDQCDGQLDMIVLGCGTGGTLTGIGRKLREISPKTKIIGADPFGSTYAEPASLNKTDIKFIEIEGIGYEITPPVCDRSVVDKWYKVDDRETLIMSRRLIKEEGLLVGGSSGVALVVAIKAIKEFNIGRGKKVVVLLPDGTKSYLSKFVRDQWMEQRNFMPCINTQKHWWWDINVADLKYRPVPKIMTTQILEEVLEKMNQLSVDFAPVTDNTGHSAGIAVRRNLLNKLISDPGSAKNRISLIMDRLFSKLPSSSTLGLVSRVLEIEPYVVIVDCQGGITRPLGVLTSDDVFGIIKNKVHN